jgi:hypothetical protein
VIQCVWVGRAIETHWLPESTDSWRSRNQVGELVSVKHTVAVAVVVVPAMANGYRTVMSILGLSQDWVRT